MQKRRRLKIVLFAVTALGALGVMAFLTVGVPFACGGINIPPEPASPPPSPVLAQHP